MSSLSCGAFWGEGKPGPGDPEWGGTKGKVRVGIWSVETNPFHLRERWGVKRGIPQIFPGLESPVPQEGALNAGAILSESQCVHLVPKWDQKRLQSSFFSPSLLLQEHVKSPAPAGPFLPWNTFRAILHREKLAGSIFCDLCEHRTQQQLRSGQGGAQFIAWNTTQHQLSCDGNRDPIPGRQG